ncbi:MAG: hypothetical protein KBF35_09950 [Saprospiraceae bacterium]|nr:hypothetical protein [Saprospiraceae bacterium]
MFVNKVLTLALYGILMSVLLSCAKEQSPTFIVPSTYRFNSPNLDSKHIYVIDAISKSFRKVTDTLGSFNRANNEIADSFNRIIQHEFLTSLLKSITFNTSDQASLVFGRLDTVGIKDNIIETNTVNTKYSLSGNQVIFDAYPEYYININNSFLELNFCQEFTLRSYKIAPGESEKKYFKTLCTDALPNTIISNIITSNPGITYDTISLEYVNYIYSRY